MRLLIAAVGRLKQGPERELLAQYVGRAASAGRKVALSPIDVVEVAEVKGTSPQARKEAEAKLLLAKRPSSYKLICLDDSGTELSSGGFAQRLAKFRDEGASGLAFLIGGADGLGDEALTQSDEVLSLSAMTLPHGLARIVLAEQIYRAITILSGHPYHRA
jgi:23S rRNA (pseudouridine1915-N3)-methyltransferase